METLVYSYRGPLKDLSYSGSAAVVNSEGKLLFYCGEPQKTVYMRSSAKPFVAFYLRQGWEKSTCNAACMRRSMSRQPRR